MTNAQNVARARHLEDVAKGAKRYILAEILDVTQAVAAELENITVAGGGTLDTTPSTVDGGLWYELSDGVPVLKLRKGDYEYIFQNSKIRRATSASDYLSVWLKFDQSATLDECGHTFEAVGNPTIGASNAVSGNALQIASANDFIKCTDGISLGGRDFTIDCWFYLDSEGAHYTEVFILAQTDSEYTNRLALAAIDANNFGFPIKEYGSGATITGENWQKLIGSPEKSDSNFLQKRFHGALVYRHAQRRVYGYLNGLCFGSAATTLFESAINYPLLKIGGGHTSNSQFTGSIDEFRIHDGIALWTSDFTTPTAEDYT